MMSNYSFIVFVFCHIDKGNLHFAIGMYFVKLKYVSL